MPNDKYSINIDLQSGLNNLNYDDLAYFIAF